MQNLIQQIRDELQNVLRFRWLALIAAWIVCVVGWSVVYAMPDIYEAYARVYVDTRTPLRPLLSGVAAEQDVDSQIVMVRQALLGKPNLARVARQAGLLEENPTPEHEQRVISGLTQRIVIELEPVAGRDQRTPNTFYRIRYQDGNRDRSLKVVDLLLNAFVEDTFGTKRDSAQSAEAFLVNQLARYRQRLTVSEAALAEFKRSNIGMLPGSEGGYFERLDQEESNVQRVSAALRVAMARKAELGRQIRGESPFLQSTPVSARPSNGGASAPVDTASRIQEAQARLDELLLRFTEKHPDVIATRQNLEDLKVRQLVELDAVQRGEPGAAAIAGASANPVYQGLRVQLHETEVQIAALRGELSDYQGNVRQLRHALDTAPEVEAEYTRLTRDYEVTQTQYNALLQRLEQARVSEDAQQTGIIDFQILDPPTASLKPIFPARPLFLALVLLAAIGIGAGTAWLIGKLRPVFHHARGLADLTGLPVIGVIGMTWVEEKRVAMRLGHLRFAAVSVLLLLSAIVVTVAHEPASRFVRQLIS